MPVPDADAFIVMPVVLDRVRPTADAPDLCQAELLWIDAGLDGLSIERETSADGGASGWLRLANVNVPASAQLAAGDFWPIFDEASDYGVIGNCAELLGNMERCLELTLEYLKTRSQFGQQIGKFQVLQHRTVDLWMNKEVARHALTASLGVIQSPGVPADARAQAASSAKARSRKPRSSSATTPSSCMARSGLPTNMISRSTSTGRSPSRPTLAMPPIT